MVAESVDEHIEVTVRRRLDSVETLLAIGIFSIDAIRKKQVKVKIEIQCRAKALDQGHWAGMRCRPGVTGLFDGVESAR